MGASVIETVIALSFLGAVVLATPVYVILRRLKGPEHE